MGDIIKGDGEAEFAAGIVFASDDLFPGQRAFGTRKSFHRTVSKNDPHLPFFSGTE